MTNATTIVDRFLASLVQNETIKPWEYTCIKTMKSSGYGWNNGLVNESGHSVTNLSTAWGVDLATCKMYCDAGAIPYALDFNFQTFSAAMTNYFLPWLALTAQLPFETGDAWSNIMSFCLAVGSPALVTYSLSITILNRSWVSKAFGSLRSVSREKMVESRYVKLADRIDTARFLLQEAQQVPLRASQEKGWFSSLLVIPGNATWWAHVRERLGDTRRGVTASLVAQMLFAAIAYLFTVITSFNADLGDPATALQIASGSLWIWLIPVIFGWITVGTQCSHDTVERALKKDALRALEPQSHTGQQALVEEGTQKGLVIGVGLTPQPHKHQTNAGGFEMPSTQSSHPPPWLGADIRGDERQKGPIYNYARVFTWYQLADTIIGGLEHTLNNVENGKPCANLQAGASGSPSPTPSQASQSTLTSTTHGQQVAVLNRQTLVPNAAQWDSSKGTEGNMAGDSLETARYCGLTITPNSKWPAITAYPQWQQSNDRGQRKCSSRSFVPGVVYQRIFAASCVCVFLQWGTTGASVIIAYLTPTLGLGCRSGSYILYAGLGTVVWLLLLISMLLSHEVMLRYQAVHVDDPSTDFRASKLNGLPTDNSVSKLSGLTFGVLRGAAVTTRYLGKFLAIVNTLWLILSSLMEFVGAYDNCWCKSNVLSLGDKAFVVLFKGAAELASAAQLSWSCGLAMALLVCTTSYTFFALGSRNISDS